MFEYLIIGGLAVVVIFAFLIYQKIGSKNKENTDEIGLSDIKERLGNIENAQQAIEKLNEKIIDFENISVGAKPIRLPKAVILVKFLLFIRVS